MTDRVALARSAHLVGRQDQVRSLDEAAELLRSPGADLVIVDRPLAEELLTTMRAEDLRAPVVVFARGDSDSDRRRWLSLGATDSLHEWADLFREIERVLG